VTTIVTHAAVPLALGFGLGSKRIAPWLVVAGMAAAMAPDLDVIGFRLGIAYGDPLGHRGASHSLVAAAVIGLLGALAARRLHERFATGFLFLFIAAASHGLLDTFTDGGRGVALLWPFSDERLFAPVRPIAVSPLGVRRIFSEQGMAVMTSELVWVWLPCAVVTLGLMLFRRAIPPLPPASRAPVRDR
jgi:inner membrane protein